MDVFSRDEMLAILQNEMNELSKFNTESVVRLASKKKDNQFLEGVLNDYKKHNEYMLKLKRQQIEQIEYLLNYIENSLAQAGVTEMMINQANYERKNLLRELETVKSSIDELITLDKTLIT